MIYDLVLDKVEEKGFNERHLNVAVAVFFALSVVATYLTKQDIPTLPHPMEKTQWLDMICAQADDLPLRVPNRTGEPWGENRGISYGRRVHRDYYVSTWRGEGDSPWRGIVFEPRHFGKDTVEYSTTCSG